MVLFAIGLAMGLVTLVLSIAGEFENTGTLLGIGVFCLGLAGVRSITKTL